MIFITLKSRDKTCSKIEKTWFLLVYQKKSKSIHPKVFRKKFAEYAGKTIELQSFFKLVHWKKNSEAVVQNCS